MKIILLLLASVSGALAASPILLYSDLTDGPRTGGENGKGAYVCVYGRNFGATRGSSVIKIGGTAVDNYPVWGSGNAVSRGDDKACFQLGTSVPTGAQTIQMTVGGQTSNTLPFYVRPDAADAIYCVSDVALPAGGTTPSDSNDGHFGTTTGHGCWATLEHAGTALYSSVSTLVYIHNVGTNEPTANYGLSFAFDTYGAPGFTGAPNAYFGLLGYPGAPGTFGEYSRGFGHDGKGPWGLKFTRPYAVIANLNFRGLTNAFTWGGEGDTIAHYSHDFRVIGNDVMCESTQGGSGCSVGRFIRTFALFGNIFHDVANSAPHGYMATAIPSSPYDSTDAVLTSVTTDGAGNCTANVANGPGDVVIGEGYSTSPAQSGDIEFMNAPPGIQGMIGIVSAKTANSFTFSCPSAAPNSTFDSSNYPKMWYSARQKYEHTLYIGEMATDYEISWNEFRDNYASPDIQLHSTQADFGFYTPNNPSAKGYWAVPQPLTPAMVPQIGWPSMNTTSGCTSGTCAVDHTYYVSFSWQGNGGETQASHETPYTIAAGQRLTVTAPPFVLSGSTMSTPLVLNGQEACGDAHGVDCTPTGWCVYVGATPGTGKQQACSSTPSSTWSEPVSGITTSGSARLTWLTQSAGYLGGLAGTHIRVHDNLIHGGAGDPIRSVASDPTPSGMWGDDDTPGGVYIYNNLMYHQSPYSYQAPAGGFQEIGVYANNNPDGSGMCIHIQPLTHNGPIPQGNYHVENNTCYDINSGGWLDHGTYAGMIIHGGKTDWIDSTATSSCQSKIIANNNLFVATSTATIIPWVSAWDYSSDGYDCANSLLGQKNVWWSTVDATRKPPDAAALNGDSSCVPGGRTVGRTCFTANISSDPKFTDPTTGDFTLQASSPVISAGIDTTPTTDYYGNVRPSGSYSLGAIQFNNGCTVSLSPATPGPYTVGQTISTITATATNCGAGTLTWTSSGLPTGVSGCNSVTGTTCTITGTVTAAGTFSSANVSVTDGGANSASKTVSITVNAAPSITSSGSLATGVQGVAYSQALATTGGTSPFTCAVVTGALPTGLSFSGCTIQGTPSGSTGTATFTAHATDANGITGATSASLSITINAAPTPPTVTTSSLPGGVIGAAYSATLAATGDTPITWSIVVGSLPAWASLNSSTGAITGTPNAAATTTFTVRATNAAGHDDKALSITVTAVPPLTRTQGLTFRGLPVIR